MTFPFEKPVDGVGMVAVPAAGITTNIFAVGPGDDYLLIDCGTDSRAPRIIETLVAAGYRPGRGRAVIPTHGHADHFGGAAKLSAWAGAPVWAHPATAVQAEDHWGQFVARGDIGIDESEQAWKGFKEWAGDEVVVERMLREGEEVEIPGGGKFEVLHCPGHERGLIVLHDAERKLAFCGDLIQGGYNCSANWLALIPDPQRQRRSLERLAALSPEWLFKGHREPVSGEVVKRDIEAALARVERISNAVLESLDENSPETLAELTRKAFVKVLDHVREDSPPYALMTVGGALAVLHRKGKVRRNADLTWEPVKG
jgi:glyoxylase-like metal-dependent hydrolase (beta-lactamase superfamily II)